MSKLITPSSTTTGLCLSGNFTPNQTVTVISSQLTNEMREETDGVCDVYIISC
jgi:hypothetical protein